MYMFVRPTSDILTGGGVERLADRKTIDWDY